MGSAKDTPLNPCEVTLLRSLAGQLNWAATQTRPDIAFANCMTSSSIKNATRESIHRANKAVRALHQHNVKLRFPRLDLQEGLRLVAFSDASFANLPGEGSQGGMLVFLVDHRGKYVLLAWQSHRIQRVVNSTLSAECLAVVDACNMCVYLRSALLEMLCSDIKIPISVLTDNKSITDSIHLTTISKLENKRLRVDFAVLRDSLKRGEIDELRWIPDPIQVADCLTKESASVSLLLKILSSEANFTL